MLDPWLPLLESILGSHPGPSGSRVLGGFANIRLIQILPGSEQTLDALLSVKFRAQFQPCTRFQALALDRDGISDRHFVMTRSPTEVELIPSCFLMKWMCRSCVDVETQVSRVF